MDQCTELIFVAYRASSMITELHMFSKPDPCRHSEGGSYKPLPLQSNWFVIAPNFGGLSIKMSQWMEVDRERVYRWGSFGKGPEGQ